MKPHFVKTEYKSPVSKQPIALDPRYSDTAVAYADEWIPILPTTDNAMMDAMAYVIVTENLHDKKFLDTYVLGFDEEHMPQGVPAQLNPTT